MRYITKALKVARFLDEKGEKTKEFKVDTEIPQFDTLTEASQNAGGDEKLLSYINGAVAADSAIPARTAGRAKGNLEKTDDDFISLVQKLRKEFSLSSVDRSMSQKDKVSFADQALAIANDSTIDETERMRRLLDLTNKARSA